jgi:hypothetical protein
MTQRTAKVKKPVSPKPVRKPATEELISPFSSLPISENEIRLNAYLRWEAAGKPVGDGIRFWFEAERELLQKQF